MDNSKVIGWIGKYWLIVVIGVVGLGIIIYGLWLVMRPTAPTVEIIRAGEGEPGLHDAKIVVDVAGEVVRPGVYTLDSKARIGEALVAAGGLSLEADREWVSKNINLAQELKDGQKIFIPKINYQISNSNNQAKSESQTIININTASQSVLESLWGIGATRAQAIIANRPYSETEELVSKAKIPQNVYDKIKDKISI